MFEFHIEKDICCRENRIYIYSKNMNQEAYITMDGGHLKYNEFDPNDPKKYAKPFLSVPYEEGKDFFKGFSDFLSGEDLKTDNDIKIKGTLDATRNHLDHCKKIIDVLVLKEKS